MSLFEPFTTAADREAHEKAAAVGLRLRKLHTDLYDFENTWCPVILTRNSQCWSVSRKALSNRVRRWKTVYQGPNLKTALKHAKRWEETFP